MSRSSAVVLAAVVWWGCGEPGDPVEDPFAEDRVLDVKVELAPGDWVTLGAQTRTATEVLANCALAAWGDPYTYFRGTVTIDGHVFRDSGVRKKGFLGSSDAARPSLKLKLDELVDGRRYAGLKTLTLNNAKQDPARVRTCLAYGVFAAAGIPAPRCNFARVTVNGADLGVYVHVESGSKDFLRRHFDDPDGNLYEGTVSDFRAAWTATFERKTNEDDDDRRDLDAVVAALARPDGELLAALAPVIDVDAFLRFWAVESLIGQRDGYAGGANNFYAYHDPKTGRFQLMPWGADTTFDGLPSPFDGPAPTVLATALLARRLYLLPATRDRYLGELRALLDDVWDETALVAEIDRLATLADADADAVEAVRSFVRGRRAQIERDLAGGPPAWREPLRDPPCYRRSGELSGSFQARWGQSSGGSASVSGTLEGTIVKPGSLGAVGSVDPDAKRSPAWDRIVMEGGSRRLVLLVEPGRLRPNTDLALGFGSAWLFASGPETSGVFSEGTLHLDAVDTQRGGVVSGSFQGVVVSAADDDEHEEDDE